MLEERYRLQMQSDMEKKYFCRTCKGPRNHRELFNEKTRGEDDEYFMWIESFAVIQCLGCETNTFLKTYGDNTMVEHDERGIPDYYYVEDIYPQYLEAGNEITYVNHLPPVIRLIYSETINAFKAGSLILTAGGLRAIIEAVCNNLSIKKGNLEERIDLLHNKGYLTLNESRRLHSIRFLGNDALHEIEKPKKHQLHLLLEIINHLLNNLYINDKLINGRVVTVIHNYDGFLLLIKNRISSAMIAKVLSLNEILENSKRQISKRDFSIYEKQFIKEVEDGKHSFMSLHRINNEVKFKIEKEPEPIIFNWEQY